MPDNGLPSPVQHFYGNAISVSPLTRALRRDPNRIATVRQRMAGTMATKQILEGARSFKLAEPDHNEDRMAERRYWRWPSWPSRLSLRPKDKYLIDIRPRRLPG